VKSPRTQGAPEGTVHQHADPHNPVDAFKLYVEHMTADPHREVALIYNQHLDQWASCRAVAEKLRQTPHSRSSAGRSRTRFSRRHSHGVGTAGQTAEHNQLPSAKAATSRLSASSRASIGKVQQRIGTRLTSSDQAVSPTERG
jgi:hypothetical protein